MSHDVFIVARARTPIGAMGGSLSTIPAPQLAAECIRAVVNDAKLSGEQIDEVIMGNVLSAGLGQNPARQSSIAAGIPAAVGATTVNKVCGSGLKSVMLAAQAIRAGDAQIVIAGGMENMSLAPHLLPHARTGYRLGNGVLVDSMIHDGLWDVYGEQHMGNYGDRCAAKFAFTREQVDDFAVRTYTRAHAAARDGVFFDEITPVKVATKKETTVINIDEGPAKFNETKLRALKPAFDNDGVVTAGNASSIGDGAAALLVVGEKSCQQFQLSPQARIVGSATFSQDPAWFTTAPIGAISKLLHQLNWNIASVDLFEINEAFAVVTMAAERELDIPSDKCNIYGGAVALGHPIGASGARILVTLLTGLLRTGGKRGVAALCIGGGEAVAIAVER